MIEFQNVFYTYDAAPSKKHTRKKQDVDQEKQPAWGNTPEEHWALQDISFTLSDGEFFGIAGHTGSGKSTLIQHMNGLLHPSSGCVRVGGIDISSKGAAAQARCDVGLVFQYPEHQLFAATVYDDVAFGPRNMGLSSDEADKRIREAMEAVELDFEALRDKSPFALSGGQQRRVAFAGVLAMRPRTLILDEPVAGLDPEARADFLDLISTLHETEGLTVVMVSHDMDDLARLCNRILVLNTGKVFALGTPAEVFADGPAIRKIGLDVPNAQRLAEELALQGVDVVPPCGLHTIESLAEGLAARYRKRD